MQGLVIFTDGGARGNPGPAGAGVVCYESTTKLFELMRYLGERTNNWAEYEALILGLAEAKKRGYAGRSLEVKMDSELVVKQMRGEYQVKEETLWPQYMKAHNLLVANFKNAVFTHIPRAQNAEADALVNRALDERVV